MRNLRPRPGQAVEGVLFRANDAALAALDAKEGAPLAYRARRHLILPDGRAVEAMTYVAGREGFCPPHPDYIGIVRRGQAAHGIGHAMLEAAARDEAARHPRIPQGDWRAKATRHADGAEDAAPTPPGAR